MKVLTYISSNITLYFKKLISTFIDQVLLWVFKL